MTRVQFLNDLYHHLYGLTREQAEQHLTYYAEMLADRMEEGMSEEDAVASMEDVETIARRIMEGEGLPYTPPEERPPVPPAYPDATRLGGGGGTRAYQAPKRWKWGKNWRRLAQITLWAVAAVAVVGALGRLFGMFSGNRMFHNYDTTNVVDSTPALEEAPSWEYSEQPYIEGFDFTGGEKHIAASDVEGIDIEWASGQVYIQSYEGDDILVQEYAQSELTERTMMDLVTEGNVLTIRYRSGVGLGNVKGTKWLNVLIPDGMMGQIDVNTVSANVMADGLELDTLHVETASGEFSAIECYTQTVNITTISGNVNLSNLVADQLEAHTTSGYFSGDMQSESILVATTSGDINLTSMPDDVTYLDLQTVSGDIWASVSSSIISGINVITTSGDTSLSLPYDVGFTLDYSTVSGDFDSSFELAKQNGQYIYAGGGYNISAVSVSGDLSIY